MTTLLLTWVVLASFLSKIHIHGANITSDVDVIYHFNETCCEANGVSPGCMDLCREVEARKDILPISKCVQHQDTIESCLIAEVNCEWSDWVLGECSASCGGGTLTKTRTKTVEEQNGAVCEGEATEEEACNTQVCKPVHCKWGEWDLDSGECSKECGVGEKNITREKLVVEEHGGNCTGHNYKTVECNPDPCPIDCVWDQWSQWSECEKTCAGGEKTRSREALVDAEHGGKNCNGSYTETITCNEQECPVDCEWGDWVAGECSTTCGPGVQIDARQKVQEELYGGTCEGNATKETDCSKEECPIIYRFNETCCKENSVSEDCMGFCRAEEDRSPKEIFPIPRCAKYDQTIRSCMFIQPEGDSSNNALLNYEHIGKGFCPSGYYRGWAADPDHATMDAQKCAIHCTKEPECCISP